MNALIRLLLFAAALTASADAAAQPVEAGAVAWGTDLAAARRASAESGKPVFLLFQEIPGCAGCQKFGREVLSHPLLVEAVETEFIPVLVHNNRAGKDAEILKRFNEPAWNYQVVRFLDSAGKDIIPRKDRIWTLDALAGRMAETLRAAKRPVPAYLDGLRYEEGRVPLESLTFSMFCFWTGEMKLGGIPGVVKTEAGFFDRREVTRVWFDPARISRENLVRQAAKIRCANRVYFNRKSEVMKDLPAALTHGIFAPRTYRPAPASDQKKQLQGTPPAKQALTEYQRTKLNAFVRSDPAKALTYLSPRQRERL